jgi:hypothetical protein
VWEELDMFEMEIAILKQSKPDGSGQLKYTLKEDSCRLQSHAAQFHHST